MKEMKAVNRIVEWDIARAMAIVGMIFVHCAIATIERDLHPRYVFVTNFLGSPMAAPMFMFLLGACIPHSSHNDAASLFRRGIKFIALSYVFNFLVFALPFGYRTLLYHEHLEVKNFIVYVFSSEILVFAGLTFVFFSIVKRFNVTIQTMLGMVILFIILNKILSTYCTVTDNIILKFVFAPFYGTEYSFFPFLAWIGYPIAGYIFAKKVYSEKKKDLIYGKLGLAGLFIFIAFTILSTFRIVEEFSILIPESWGAGKFYRHGLFTYIMLLGWIFFELWACFLISKVIPQQLLRHLQRWSKNITPMYVISYIPIFIIYVTIFNRNPNLSAGYTFLISLVIFGSSDWLSTQYRKIKARMCCRNDLR